MAINVKNCHGNLGKFSMLIKETWTIQTYFNTLSCLTWFMEYVRHSSTKSLDPAMKPFSLEDLEIAVDHVEGDLPSTRPRLEEQLYLPRPHSIVPLASSGGGGRRRRPGGGGTRWIGCTARPSRAPWWRSDLLAQKMMRDRARSAPPRARVSRRVLGSLVVVTTAAALLTFRRIVGELERGTGRGKGCWPPASMAFSRKNPELPCRRTEAGNDGASGLRGAPELAIVGAARLARVELELEVKEMGDSVVDWWASEKEKAFGRLRPRPERAAGMTWPGWSWLTIPYQAISNADHEMD
uniref:Uncharacterized protein n=1 Tax=Aegilops tauschii TaxID=37682 RepID=R7WFI7_AEGTA